MSSSNNLLWFNTNQHEELTIEYYERVTDHDPVKTVTIKDASQIKIFVDKISSLPVEGDKYISFSEFISLTRLTFKNGNVSEEISFYGSRIKTPSTSFYSFDEKVQEEEKIIYSMIKDLLK